MNRSHYKYVRVFIGIILSLLIIDSCKEPEKEATPPPVNDSIAARSAEKSPAPTLKIETWGTIEIDYEKFRVFLGTTGLQQVRMLPYKLKPSEQVVRLYCFAEDIGRRRIDDPVFIPATSDVEPDHTQVLGDTNFILSKDDIWRIENTLPRKGNKLKLVPGRADFPGCGNCPTYTIYKDQTRVKVLANPSPPGKMISDTSNVR